MRPTEFEVGIYSFKRSKAQPPKDSLIASRVEDDKVKDGQVFGIIMPMKDNISFGVSKATGYTVMLLTANLVLKKVIKLKYDKDDSREWPWEIHNKLNAIVEYFKEAEQQLLPL